MQNIWPDGIAQISATEFSKTWAFTDINYMSADDDGQTAMFLKYSAALNSIDSSSTVQITVNNRRLDRSAFERDVLMQLRGDDNDKYRAEYNRYVTEKAMSDNGIFQERYITTTVQKRTVQDARTALSRSLTSLSTRFRDLGSRLTPLNASERLKIFHDFYRPGEESYFHIDIPEMRKRGHDFRDYICPDGIERHSDYIVVGGKQFCRVLFLKEYGAYVDDDMVGKLTDASRPMMLSITISPVPMDAAIRQAEEKVMAVDINVNQWQQRQNKNNNYSAAIPPDMEMQRREAREFLSDLRTRNQRMFQATITVLLTAESKEELDAVTDDIKSIGQEKSCQFATLQFMQQDGLNSVLPFGKKILPLERTLITESLAVFLPFRVQEIQEPGGTCFGVNPVSKNLILLNRANLLNQSSIICGIPGSGKSMMAKQDIATIILDSEDDVLIADPEGEFAPLAKALGRDNATIIRMAAGGRDRLNAMQLEAGYSEDNALADKSEFIMSLIEQIDGTAVGPHHRSIIDRCVTAVYSKAAAADTVPTLSTLRQELLEQPEPEAQAIALSLELYTDGNLDIFGHESTVNINNRIVVFDLHSLSAQLKAPALLIVTDTILNRVSQNWAAGKRTHIIIDEYHIVYENKHSAMFFDSAWRMFRKRNGFPTAITQNVEFLLDSPNAKLMLSNSEFLVMFRQSDQDRLKFTELFSASDKEMAYCADVQAGCGLIRYGRNLIPFENHFPKDTELYQLFTTKPGEGVFGGKA